MESSIYHPWTREKDEKKWMSKWNFQFLDTSHYEEKKSIPFQGNKNFHQMQICHEKRNISYSQWKVQVKKSII